MNTSAADHIMAYAKHRWPKHATKEKPRLCDNSHIALLHGLCWLSFKLVETGGVKVAAMVEVMRAWLV